MPQPVSVEAARAGRLAVGQRLGRTEPGRQVLDPALRGARSSPRGGGWAGQLEPGCGRTPGFRAEQQAESGRGLLTKLMSGPRLLSLRFCRSVVGMENFISNKFRGNDDIARVLYSEKQNSGSRKITLEKFLLIFSYLYRWLLIENLLKTKLSFPVKMCADTSLGVGF